MTITINITAAEYEALAALARQAGFADPASYALHALLANQG